MAQRGRHAGPLPVLGTIVGEDARRRLDAGHVAVQPAMDAGVDDVVRCDERIIRRPEIVAAAHSRIAAVETAVVAHVADAGPGVRPRDAAHVAEIDAFRAQAVGHQIAEKIGTETAEIARLGTAAPRLHGNVDSVAAGILHALGQVDIDGVVADAEEAQHQYSVFHM